MSVPTRIKGNNISKIQMITETMMLARDNSKLRFFKEKEAQIVLFFTSLSLKRMRIKLMQDIKIATMG